MRADWQRNKPSPNIHMKLQGYGRTRKIILSAGLAPGAMSVGSCTPEKPVTAASPSAMIPPVGCAKAGPALNKNSILDLTHLLVGPHARDVFVGKSPTFENSSLLYERQAYHPIVVKHGFLIAFAQ